MRKTILLYLIAFAAVVSVLVLFNREYRGLSRYSELITRHNLVYSSYQNLYREIHNAAILNPDLVKAGGAARSLFYTDSMAVIRELNLLGSSVADSINTRISNQLNTSIRQELSWLLNSNVPDSIVKHRSPEHIAAFEHIDSLIKKGISRTVFLIDLRQEQISDETYKLKLWITLFIILSGCLLVYITYGLFRQQSQRKRKEQELDSVFNRINDSVVSVDNCWRYTFLNDTALSTHPLGKAETLGKSIWDVHPEMKGTIFWDKYHEAMITKKVVEIEDYYAPMDIWFSVKVYPSSDGLTIFYKDITTNKKAEQALLQTLREVSDYKFALDESSIVAITDHRGIINYVNNNFCKISKYSTEELVGQDHRIINSGYHDKAFIKDLWVTIANGKIWKGELKNKAKDGSTYWVDTTIVPFLNDNGKPYQYVAIRSDITERKKLEEEQALYVSIVNYSHDAILSKTLDGVITTWNQGAEKIFGYTTAEIVGQHIAMLIPTFYWSQEYEIMESIRQGKIIDHYVTERIRKDGKIIPVSLTISPLKDAAGNIIGASKIVRDISKQKQAEQEISQLNAGLEKKVLERTSELTLAKNKLSETLERISFLASIADNIQDPVISTDNNGIITRWNTAAELLLEWKSEEVIGKNAAALLQVNYLDTNRETIYKALDEQNYWQGEVIYYSKSGKPLNVLITASHLKDADGNILGNLALVRDITERKKAEDALSKLNDELEQKVADRTAAIQRSEAQYRHLFVNNPMPMWVFDLETFKFLDVNDTALLQYGYSREEFLSMTALDIRPEEERNKFLQLDHSYSPDRPAYNKGVWRHRRKNGSLIQAEVIAHEIFFEGIKARLVLAKDVTEEKKMQELLTEHEEQLGLFIKHSPVSLAMLDKDLIYQAASNRWIADFGLDEKNLLGRSHYDIFPEITQEWKEIHQRCLQGAIEKSDEDLFVREDGSKSWIRWAVHPWHKASGEVGGIIIFSEEITARKEAEEKIVKLNEELEEKVISRTEQLKRSSEEMEAFSYSVSHDLRAPLRGIIGFANILEEDYGSKLDDEAKRITGIIKNNTTKMGMLIDDLLSFSRLGRQPVTKIKISFNDIINEVIAEPGIKKNNGHLQWIVPELPAVGADPNTIKQVWMNLVSNAVKYSNKTEHPVVEIGSIAGKDETIFFIKDNGVGFDTKYADKLFKVFQRLHSTHEFEGTGVGLAIVEKIISRHGGRVWAESEPGKGACFYFSLPHEPQQLNS